MLTAEMDWVKKIARDIAREEIALAAKKTATPQEAKKEEGKK
jgi:hypothetical protein